VIRQEKEITVAVTKGFYELPFRILIPGNTLAAALDWIAADGYGIATASTVAREVLRRQPNVPTHSITAYNGVGIESVAAFERMAEFDAKVLHSIAEERGAPPLPSGDTSVEGALVRMGRLSCMPLTGERLGGWYYDVEH